MDTISTGKFLVKSNAAYKKFRAEYIDGQMKPDKDRILIEEIYEPLTLKRNNVLVAGDWHGTKYDRPLKQNLYRVAEEFSVDTLIVPGDLWDCDAYTPFVRFNQELSFRNEIKTIKEILLDLTSRFKAVYFCRGNHEKRWISMNKGMMGIQDLFAVTGVTKGYKVTMDDHILLQSNSQMWRVCHPREFSKITLKIPKALADKYHMNIFYAHGHRLAWCLDDTGSYQCVEGGGMFDKDKIEYLRDTSAFPETASGFYLIQDGWASVFPGKRTRAR